MKSETKRPKPPDSLSSDARALWTRLVDEFAIDDAAALAILERACEAFQRMRQAQGIIDKDGLTTTDRFGQAKPHPAVTIERDSRASFLQAMKALRLDIEPLRDGPGRPPAMGR